MPVSGAGLGAVLAGSVFLYAGVRGVSVLASIKAVVQGKSPSSVKQSAPITAPADDSGGGGGTGTMPTSKSGQAALQQAAQSMGWTGAQWQALQQLEAKEDAGFNPKAVNASSGALGIGQALGHGTSSTGGSLGNEYGGYGLTTAQAKAANSGDPDAQALWMVNYIADTYGTPEQAWAHEQADRWY